MDKNKLKDLIGRVDEIQNSLPFGESHGLADEIVRRHLQDLTSQVKDSPSIRFLDAINYKLDKFKEDFDLKPILDDIDSIKGEIENLKTEISADADKRQTNLETKLSNHQQLIDSLQKSIGETDGKTTPLYEGINSLKEEFVKSGKTGKQTTNNLNSLISGLQNSYTDLSNNFTEAGKSHKADLDKMSASLSKNFQTALAKMKADILTHHGGASMYQQPHEEYPTSQTVGLSSYTFEHIVTNVYLGGQKLSALASDYTLEGSYTINLAQTDPANLPINIYS